MKYLICTFYGALQSWGVVLPGRIRPTDDHPTKSGSIGVAGCCLGVPRGDPQMDVLNQNLGFACRMDAPGQPYKDYQTAQMPKPKGKRGQNDGENGESNTIEIFKDYLAGAAFTVCFWAKTGEVNLEEIRDAMNSPKISPCLGRWNCPVGWPLNPEIVEADDPIQAMAKREPPSMIQGLLKKTPVYWEGNASVDPLRSGMRRDQVTSIKTRSFKSRLEHMAIVERGVACSKQS